MTSSPRILAIGAALGICLAAVLWHPFFHIDPQESTHHEIYRTIQRQLEAVRAADFGRAYHHSARETQERLTPVQFEYYVRRQYANLALARQVEFGAIRFKEDTAVVEVFFVQRNGTTQPCLFTLRREHGIWKIEEVDFLGRWPPGYRLSGRQA